MSFHLSTDVGIWVSALLTLFVFSFLYKDNPLYKLAEHLFVGVSAGYYMILNFWTVIWPNLLQPLGKAFAGAGVKPENHGMWAASLGDYRLFLLVPLVFGVLLFTRLFGKIGWLSRWSLAVIIGVYAGIKTTGFAQSDFVEQVRASLIPLWTGSVHSTIGNIVLFVGVISSLLFFFFSREHKGALGVASRLGMYFLMISFGAGYGYTVMSRVSLLIGRFMFLIEDVLGRH